MHLPESPMSRLDRITVHPAICHGKPTIRGMRMPVQTILELLASGMTFEEVLADYPYLERADLLAALEYGAVHPAANRSSPPREVHRRRPAPAEAREFPDCKGPRRGPRRTFARRGSDA